MTVAPLQLLFDELVALDPSARAARLAELAGEDPGLAAELADLLAHWTDGNSTGDAPIRSAIAAVAASLGESTAAQPGQVIDGYRLLEEIGHGGMGSVYLAERTDQAFAHRVAIKLVRGFPSPPVLERFRRERELLARLRHPNIARLFDGGTTAAGQPYLVMEHVDGVPLDAWCRTTRPSLHARLQLFLQLCAAVQHAHQNLVLHRDLKPANVLVRASGEPVLLDFGIGTWLAVDGVPHATQSGVMTPAYASPEQLRGEPSTTLSDVYGLGLVLFELLAGEPFRANEASGTTRRSPSRLAARAEPWLAADARRMRGDLDTIVARALQEDPSRRYASAAAFAADIRAWCVGRPVSAVPDSWHYVLRRFVARHRFASSATVGALLLLAALSLRLLHEREEARSQAESANQSAAFLVDLLQATSPEATRGNELTVRALLEQAERDLARRQFSRPEVQARLQSALGEIHHSLGLWQHSERLLTPAVATLRRAPDDNGPVLVHALTLLARSQNALGQHQRGRALAGEALELGQRLLPAGHLSVGHALMNLGVAEQELGDAVAARARFEQAERLFAAAGPEAREHRAAALHNLGWAARRGGDIARARVLLQQALEAKLEAVGALHPSTFATIGVLALLEGETGDYDAAAARLQRLLEDQRRLLGEPNQRIAATLSDLGFMLHDAGRLAEAAVPLEAAVRQHEALGTTSADRAPPLNNYASLLEDQERFAEAEPLFRQSLAIRIEAGAAPLSVARAHHNLARLWYVTGRLPDALDAAQASWHLRSSFERQHPEQLDAMLMLARIEAARGDRAAAETWMNRFQADAPSPLPSRQQSRWHEVQAELAEIDGDRAGAIAARRARLAIEAERMPERHPGLARQRLGLARLLAEGTEVERAEARALIALAGPAVEAELAPGGPTRALLSALQARLR